MTNKELKRFNELRKMVDGLLSLDDACNYDCADAAAESVLSELETDHEFSELDASIICGMVSDWYCENEQ